MARRKVINELDLHLFQLFLWASDSLRFWNGVESQAAYSWTSL